MGSPRLIAYSLTTVSWRSSARSSQMKDEELAAMAEELAAKDDVGC
jgi:hypothetical protein